MARLILKTKTGPAKVTVGNKDIYICQCGLTKNKDGLCDGSHKAVLDEGRDTVYCYDKKGRRVEAKVVTKTNPRDWLPE